MDTSKFAELGLNEQILAGVEALGFTDPTPVQKEAIPLVLAGRDVVASAQTGTGKTAAFALPVLQVIEPYSRAARQQDASENSDKPADKAKPGDESAERDAPAASTKATAEVVVDIDEAGATTGEVPPCADSVASESAAKDSGGEPSATEPTSEDNPHDGESDGTVLADAMPGEPHISEPAPSDGVVMGQQNASEPSPSEKPKRPRRRHHKKASAKSASTGEDAANDAAAQKSAAKNADSKNESASTDDSNGHTKPQSDKPKSKPKRKRRKKHAKKKSSLAAEIDAAVDPNAHPFGPFALVVTPTRELAQQIDDVVSKVCEHTGQRAVIVMGGAKFERQIRDLQKGCDMLVATPGRLIDLMDHNHVDLSQVKVLVLDEADRMLDMGFWPSVRRIVDALPKDRQTLLFSATIPPSIKGTVDAMLHDPAKVEIARIGETADTVDEHLCPVTQGQKIELLEALINRFDSERVLVFCRTKHRVDDVSTYLAKAGLSVDVMHADRSQKERERALAKFRSGKCKILVATDVMSRGIDVSGIDAVVNFDVPMDPEDYVHRIGRTGRAGHKGLAFTFVAPDEISPLREIEYFTKKLIPVWDLEGFDYDDSRIVPNPDRSTKKPMRTMFNGARARGRGIGAGRYGRHY